MDARTQIIDIAAILDALLRIRHAAGDAATSRNSLAARYLANELRRWQPQLKLTASLDEIIAAAAALASADLAVVRRRCLFYGCDDLIGLLVHKRVKGDAIAREEAVLYVQDRLQRDDFRRIAAFQSDRGATFVTYMWQVINNLLLDFLRAHGKKEQRNLDSADAEGAALHHAQDDIDQFTDDEWGRPQTHSEGQVEALRLRALLAETMNEAGVDAQVHPLRARLREHLQLSSKDRVLLKAMFQYDMTIAEICQLPGFDMSAAEVYRNYYRIMQGLLQAFKQAGMGDALRALVSNVAPRVAMLIDGEQSDVAANRIHYLLKSGTSTACHVRWRGGTHAGVIADGFAKVLKRLAAYFSAIDSMTALSDNLLAATYRQWVDSGEVAIAGVERKFRIGARFLLELRARFAPLRDEKRVDSLV